MSQEVERRLANCGLCGNPLTNVDFSIECKKADCKKWFHGTCVNIPQDLGLRFVKVLGQFNWTCPGVLNHFKLTFLL